MYSSEVNYLKSNEIDIYNAIIFSIKMKEYDTLKFLINLNNIDVLKYISRNISIMLFCIKEGDLKSFKIIYLSESFDILKTEFCIYEAVAFSGKEEVFEFLINNHDKHSFLYQYNNFFYLFYNFLKHKEYKKFISLIQHSTFQEKDNVSLLSLLIRNYINEKKYNKLLNKVLNNINKKYINETNINKILLELIKTNNKNLFNKIYFSSHLSEVLQNEDKDNIVKESIKSNNIYVFKYINNDKNINNIEITNIAKENYFNFIVYLINNNKTIKDDEERKTIINTFPKLANYLFINNLDYFNDINNDWLEKNVNPLIKEKIKIRLKALNF